MEKRHFTRTDFQTEGTIDLGSRTVPFSLVDVSLKGLLAYVKDPAGIEPGGIYSMQIPLPGSEIVISAEGTCVHQETRYLGFRFQSIDTDSLTHLRRLLELNTGWVDEITSELSFLVDDE